MKLDNSPDPSRNSQPESCVVNTRGASLYLGLAQSTLEKLRLTGGGPKFMKLGNAVRYRIVDMDSWMADRVVSSTSEQVGRGPSR